MDTVVVRDAKLAGSTLRNGGVLHRENKCARGAGAGRELAFLSLGVSCCFFLFPIPCCPFPQPVEELRSVDSLRRVLCGLGLMSLVIAWDGELLGGGDPVVDFS